MAGAVQAPFSPSSSSSSSPPSPAMAGFVTQERNPPLPGECFKCGQPGHWARNCPAKAKENSRPIPDCDLPVVRCPCGRGACVLNISTTIAHPNWKFYSCPGRCGFFKWGLDVAPIDVPICPCGVGKCSLNKDDPTGRWYFACRIRKNHGACRFFEWAGPQVNEILNAWKSKSVTHNDNSLAADSGHIGFASNSEMQVGVTDADLAMEDGETLNPIMENAVAVTDKNSEICIQLTEFRRLISVSGGACNQEAIYQLLYVHAHGWLSKLAFSPSRSVKDASAMRCVFPSFDLFTHEGADVVPMNASSFVQSQTQVNSLARQMSRQVSLEPSSMDKMQDKRFSRMLLKSYGKALLEVLGSLGPADHERMIKLAEDTFHIWSSNSVDYEPFAHSVNDYIEHASRLARIDDSIHARPSSRELSDLYHVEKARFDGISELHDDAVAAYRSSSSKYESLSIEVERMRNEFLRMEQELAYHEAMTQEHHAEVVKISADKEESKKSMDSAHERMNDVAKLEQDKESLLEGMTTALAIAAVQLQD